MVGHKENIDENGKGGSGREGPLPSLSFISPASSLLRRGVSEIDRRVYVSS